jgi:F0F1-type ATP synthase membrane subunit b/b'
MEKVCEELRKIERKAERIRSEALRTSEEIIAVAQGEAEKLFSDSRKRIEEESDELLNNFVREADKEREDALKKNEKAIKELSTTVEKRINEAVKTIFDAVLGKIKV